MEKTDALSFHGLMLVTMTGTRPKRVAPHEEVMSRDWSCQCAIDV